MRGFLSWDRYREGGRYDQLYGHVNVVDIRDLSELDRAERSIRRFLRGFLREFSGIYRRKLVLLKRKKVKGINVNAIVKSVLKEVGGLKRFPDDYIGSCECKELIVPKGKVEVGLDLFGFYVKVREQEIRCESSFKAKYIQYAIINGHTRI